LLARISHTFSGQIAALSIEIASQVGEDSVRATRPRPLERQDHRAECASCQRKCEKSGLTLILRRNSMKHFLKGLFFLICFCFSISLLAAHVNDSYQAKLYFNSNDLEISDNVIYIHLDNNLITTNIIRNDQQGFYIFEDDITNYGVKREKMWKCPYCNHWWEIGERCKNPDCPTNKW
jgi:hypothetical protein